MEAAASSEKRNSVEVPVTDPSSSNSSATEPATSKFSATKERDAGGSKNSISHKEIEEEIPEFREKKRLLQSLMECDKHIHKLECCLLNLHEGKVKKLYSATE